MGVLHKEDNAAGQHINNASPEVNTGHFEFNTIDPVVNIASSYDPHSLKDMFKVGASHILEATHVEFFSDEDEPEVNLGNIPNSYTVPTTPNTRIHKDHPIKNVIGDVKSSVETRRMSRSTSTQGFLSANEPTSIAKALFDSSWVNAMHEELLQFKLQQVDLEKPLVKNGDADDVDVHIYRSMIGSLIYLTASRPDIIYLKGKPTLGLWYSRDSPFELVAYTDSDYAGATQDRKSTTGGCQFLGNRLISWQCKKQTVVATSTTKAEYVVAASCCGQNKTLVLPPLQLKLNMWLLLVVVDKYSGFKINCWIIGGVEIKATVDGHDKTITEASVRSSLQLAVADGISNMSTSEIFEQLALMGFKSTRWDQFSSNIATALICLANIKTFNFSKLIFNGRSKTVSKNVNILIPSSSLKDKDPDQREGKAIMEVDKIQKMFKKGEYKQISHDKEVAQKLHAKELAKDKARQEQEKYDLEKALELQKSFSVTEVRKNMFMYLKNQGGYKQSHFKGMSYEDIRLIFESVWDQNHAFVPKDSKIEKEVMKRPEEKENKKDAESSKQVEEVIVQQEDVVAEQVVKESSKKAGGRLKRKVAKVISDSEEIISVIPLAVISPIVNWKSYCKGDVGYYEIHKADGSYKTYIYFSKMLNDFDREDLIVLYRLFNEKYASTRLGFDDLVLWGDMKIMFKPDGDDAVWKNHHSQELIEWKLYDSCGVYSLMLGEVSIHMLVEKKYPLPQDTLTRMLQWKLHVNYNVTEMAYELLRAFALRNFDLEVMEFESVQSNTIAKLPILKLGEYEMWVIRIKQYFQVQDYALWEVIENGNSWVYVPQTTQENGASVTKMSVPVTAEEKTNKKNDVKARSLLLMALPNEHQLTFSQYSDAKTMFAAIETRFRGNEATKKTQKTLLKQQYENFSASSTESLDSIFNKLQKIVSRLAILGVVITQEDLNSKLLRSFPPEWNTHVVVWMNKADIETMSIDDLYKNFKIVEQDVKKYVGASSGAQNLAFMTAPSTSSTNDVNTANPAYEVSNVSPNINTECPQVSTANFSDNTMYAFMVENPNGSNLLQQDLEQIHEDDLEAMDLKWQLSLLSMREKRYFQRTCKKIFINANDTAGYPDNTRKKGNNKDTASKEMLAIYGVGFDWSDMAEEQVQTNMALMVFLDFKVKPQIDEKGFVDSGCSRHMTGNIAYLSDFKEVMSSNDQDIPKDMFKLGASHTLETTHVEFFSDEEEPEVDLGDITNSYTVPTTPNTRIHKDHPITNVIGDVKSFIQIRRMTKPTFEQGFLSAVYEQKIHDTLNTCLYACFLSQIEPTIIAKALSNSSWVEAMQEELLQFKIQQVWILMDLPIGKRAIGTKWVFKNKKDEKGILIRNKAMLEIFSVKKQLWFAISTTEAEYMAAASCCGQVLWIQNQLMDYGYNFMNTVINIDNNNLLTNRFDAGRFQYLVLKYWNA
ncbi:hypothetical protein Tco_1106047 [Tanacetum coccineum]